ncbi:SDR family oxidoreductase [Paludibacterium purpuratum]|uniref:Short-subunit dehydrogenase n=1 Tax=Paludibacterium purpuratum TaxID=1144873 RepID=A0A4R7BCP8_9NEIS|nr:SDR family oxidoreductase [Paludibacterium purpuratum]TDR81932.1 short-subunit dehydrogenase [Paludibacterium purpuratum]
MSFVGKKVWITGASSGIGAGLARELSAQGAHLLLSARREDALRTVRAECLERADNVDIIPLDLTNSEQVRLTAAHTLERHAPIDILIHCAGVSQRALARDTVEDVDRAIMEINYFGTVALTRAVLPSMLARKRGHLVVVTSVAGKLGSPLRSSYSASKHALHGYFDCLRAEVFQDGIAVTTVCPGYIDTAITTNAYIGNGERYGKIDTMLSQGMPVPECARAILRAVADKAPEVIVSGPKERVAVYLRRFFPTLLFRLIRSHVPS